MSDLLLLCWLAQVLVLIHEANPESRSIVITIFTPRVLRPPIPTFQNFTIPSDNGDRCWWDHWYGQEDHWWHTCLFVCTLIMPAHFYVFFARDVQYISSEGLMFIQRTVTTHSYSLLMGMCRSSCLIYFCFTNHILEYCHNCVHVWNFFVTFLLLTTYTALCNVRTYGKIYHFPAKLKQLVFFSHSLCSFVVIRLLYNIQVCDCAQEVFPNGSFG